MHTADAPQWAALSVVLGLLLGALMVFTIGSLPPKFQAVGLAGFVALAACLWAVMAFVVLSPN